MTPREVYLAALNHEAPPCVPYEIGPPWEYLTEIHSPEALEPLRRRTDEATQYVATLLYHPARDWKSTRELPAGYVETEWGAVGRLHLPYIVSSPLADGWHLLDSYSFPDPYAPGRFDGLKEEADAKRATMYIRGWAFSAVWEHIWMLRGFENSLMDLYTHPDEFRFLRDRIVEFQVGIMEGFHRVGVDGIHFTDDLGTQEGPMMPPEVWREMLKPAYAAIFEAARKNGTHVWFHSDGNIREIIPDLIDLGVTVLNPIQPGPLDIDELVDTFGTRLCYSGGLDVQHLLPFGTKADIRAAVEHWVRLSHRMKGGMFICATNLIPPETPLENIEASFDICRELCGTPESGLVT